MEEQLLVPGLPPAPGGQTTQTEIGVVETHASTVQPSNETPPQQPEIGGFPWPMLIIWVAVFAGMYLLMIRPQRKREKQMRELQASITTGDNIITSSGLFGKVADIGEDCFIVEFGTNRGVRIPVSKTDVIAVRTPKMTPQATSENSQ